MTTERLEAWHKRLALCKDALQFAMVALLAILAFTAFANPAWARKELVRLGFEVREVSVAGVKVVLSQSFALSDALAEAQLSLADAREALKATQSATAHAALQAAIHRVEHAQAALHLQDQGTHLLQHKAGLQPDLPASAWVVVGRLAGSGQLQPAARIDPAGTRLAQGRVLALALRQDVIVHANSDCVTTALSDARPAASAELLGVQIVLKAGSYEAVETSACPSIGGGQVLAARVLLKAGNVRLARFADARS
jgi:hypothetical protein